MTKIDSGDTAWMLVSSALVLLMTIPGLALFYGGMVRKKNVLATLAQSFGATCLVTVLWMVAGYSLAFTPGNNYVGGLSYLFRSRWAWPRSVRWRRPFPKPSTCSSR
jgi:Amt family ammonium transporter